MTGWPAFVLHRAYHLWAMPTADRTVRIALDWLVSGLLGRDLVAVGRRDAAPVPDADAPPTVAPRVEEDAIGETGELPVLPLTGGTPTWGADPTATGSRPSSARPGRPGRAAPERHRLPGHPGPADGRDAVGRLPRRVKDAVQEPHPSLPFAEQSSASFAEQHTVEGNPADRYPLPTFREPTPSLSFGEPVGDPSPSGSFREPHPSFPATSHGDPADGPRAPYPSTSRPRHSLSADHSRRN